MRAIRCGPPSDQLLEWLVEKFGPVRHYTAYSIYGTDWQIYKAAGPYHRWYFTSDNEDFLVLFSLVHELNG